MSYWSTPEALLDVSPRDNRWPEGFDVIAALREMLAGHDTVLDFGCGDGRLVDAVDAKQYVGVDLNPYAIERCRKIYPERDFHVAIPGDPLPAASAAICYAVLLHVPDADIQAVAHELSVAAPRIIVAEILGRKYRGSGVPPVFQREADEYIAIFSREGMSLHQRDDKPYLRYGGVSISFMDFRRA